jgi:endoglucanase
MRFRILLLTLVVLLTSCTRSGGSGVPTPEAGATPTLAIDDAFMTTILLKRGMNIGDALEAPNEGDWGVTVEENYFNIIKSGGFSFVRLPVNWSAHADGEAPYTIDPDFLARVDQVVNWALARDLYVILDMQGYDEMALYPEDHRERFLALWEQVAGHYQDYSPKVLFELLNEPNSAMDAALWNEIANEALRVVRRSNPVRNIVVGPVEWYSYAWLSTLDLPPDDHHLIATFHYYLPFEFTHQGASWVGGSDAWLGTTWDGTDEEQQAITGNFDAVAAWAKSHNRPILLGEFGSNSAADILSRARWTGFVARAAEARGFAWAYWEFCSGFGAYDLDASAWRQELYKALVP